MSLFKKKKRARRPVSSGPRCVAVVAAAGSSIRMGEDDKLLLPLLGEPVLLHTLRALERSPAITRILVVTRPQLIEQISDLCRDAGLTKVTSVLAGGATRLESVYRGVSAVPPDAQLIAIHDGARPLVSQAVIAAAVQGAARCGAAAPAVPVKDTVKEAEEDRVSATLDREKLRAVQTPQVFDADLIRAALHQALTEGVSLTDDCAAVERLGATVLLTPGDERNLKITTPPDLILAEAILSKEG